jgi:hypothetical protein
VSNNNTNYVRSSGTSIIAIVAGSVGGFIVLVVLGVWLFHWSTKGKSAEKAKHKSISEFFKMKATGSNRLPQPAQYR